MAQPCCKKLGVGYPSFSCALDEKRPDLVLHWMTNGYIKSCKSVADRLVQYASSSSKRRTACLAVAQTMYAGLDESKVISAALLYKLKQPARMLEFTLNEKFTRGKILDSTVGLAIDSRNTARFLCRLLPLCRADSCSATQTWAPS